MSNSDSPTNQNSGSYLDELMRELLMMNSLYESNHSVKFRNAHSLLIGEIQRVYESEMIGFGSPPSERHVAGRDMVLTPIGRLLKEDTPTMTPRRQNPNPIFSPMTMSLIGGSKKMSVEPEGKFEKSEKVFFPEETAGNTNPVGRLIGPRGMTIRQLEKDLGCKLYIRGKGCTKDDAREESLRGRSGWEHLDEPIHVLITVRADSEKECGEKLSSISESLREFLEHPDSKLKKAQLMQLAVIEGTLKL